MRDKISKQWFLGFRDRGLGHGDFCVVAEDDQLVINAFDMSKELCQHIVDSHNDSRKQATPCNSELLSVTEVQHLVSRLEQIKALMDAGNTHMAAAKLMADIAALKCIAGI